MNTQIVLATTKKNNLSISDYYSKLCQFADDLTASGAPLQPGVHLGGRSV
jgi:hypothetical protein